MDAKKKAEEFFEIIIKRKKTLVEIPLNCSQGETGALLYLTFVKDGITPSKLSMELKVSLPRIASILNSLESKKLIKKSIYLNDKRKSLVYITKAGKSLVLEKKKEAIDNIIKIIEKLDEKDIEQYIKLSKKIANIMDEMQED